MEHLSKTYKCYKVIGPYNGKSDKNIITYILYDNEGNKVAWHEGPNKRLGCKKGDLVTGIFLESNGNVNYARSKPKFKPSQLSLL